MRGLKISCALLVLASVDAHADGAARSPKKELVGHWRFDEGKGKVARDAGAHGNHGTIHGAAWVKAAGDPPEPMDRRNRIPAAMAIRKLLAGPEAPTRAMSFLISLNRRGLTGTGFAQP